MRTMSLVMALGLAVGCSGQQLQLDRDGGIATNARGVALVGDGVAQVGMSGTTCEVSTESGMIGTDYDYPGSDDKVQDVAEGDNGDVVVVVTSDKGAHIQESDGWGWANSTDYDVDGATEAVMVAPGTVAVLSDTPSGCVVEYVGDQPATTPLDPAVCDGRVTLTPDPETGSVFVGSNQGVITVLPGSAPQAIVEDPAELSAFDKRALVLYVAALDDSELRAVERDGAVRWTVDVGGAIRDLTVFGDRGVALVSVAYEDGTGGLRAFDGLTGEEVMDQSLYTPADEIVASPDGTAVATVRPGQVDFFTTSTVWADVAEVAIAVGEVAIEL